MFLFPVVDVITVDIVVLVVSVVVVSRLDAMVGVVLPVNIIVSGTATAMTRIAKMAHPIKSQHAWKKNKDSWNSIAQSNHLGHLLFLQSDNIVRSLEQHGGLPINKSAILFWWFH